MSQAGAEGHAVGPVQIVGAGPVGRTLAQRLTAGGVPVIGVHGRHQGESWTTAAGQSVPVTVGNIPAGVARARTVIVAVKDAVAPDAAKELVAGGHVGPTQILLHTSGAWPAEEVFAGVRASVGAVGTLHPLLSLNRASSGDELQGATFALQGDAQACHESSRLVAAMGGHAVTLKAADMALYHAGASLGSNAVVALIAVAARVLQQAGVDPSVSVSALVPLLQSTLENIRRLGIPAALTGPMVRGDAETVSRHLQALGNQDAARTVYRVMGKEILHLAGARGLPAEVVRALQDLLDAPPP